MLNPSNNGIFSAVKHIGNKLTSPLQKIISDVSSTADTNPIGQQLQNIVQPQQTQVNKEQTQDIKNTNLQNIHSINSPLKKNKSEDQMAGSKLSVKKNYTEPIMKIKIQ